MFPQKFEFFRRSRKQREILVSSLVLKFSEFTIFFSFSPIPKMTSRKKMILLSVYKCIFGQELISEENRCNYSLNKSLVENIFSRDIFGFSFSQIPIQTISFRVSEHILTRSIRSPAKVPSIHFESKFPNYE